MQCSTHIHAHTRSQNPFPISSPEYSRESESDCPLFALFLETFSLSSPRKSINRSAILCPHTFTLFNPLPPPPPLHRVYMCASVCVLVTSLNPEKEPGLAFIMQVEKHVLYIAYIWKLEGPQLAILSPFSLSQSSSWNPTREKDP